MCLFTAFAAVTAYAGGDDGPDCGNGPCSNWVYLGTRASGTGQGIVAARLDKQGHLTPVGLVAEITRPTWLSAHPKLPVLYSVSDPGAVESTLYSFKVNRETGALTLKNSAATGGIGATHLAVNRELKAIFAAHFGSGQTSWLSLQHDGSIGSLLSVQQQYGTGPHPRQAAPHSHGVAVDPTERFLLANDFGADKIFIYRINEHDDQLEPAATPFVSVPAGSGPRHSVFHPNGRFLFVVSELSAQVSSYRWESWPGRLTHVQTLAMDDPAYTGTKSASHIQISDDGRFVYVANRGIHSMQVYAVNQWTGTLELIQTIPSQGQSPWDFALDPTGRWLVVANNVSNSINLFGVNRRTGKLEATAETFTMSQPSSVTFVRGED
jgi:6-phosphogluconolactonase